MNPRVFHVYKPDDTAQVVREIAWRLKLGGPVSVLLSKVGEGSEYALWMRRYHKLVALVAQHVQKDGRYLRDSEWDLIFKADFLPLDEVMLPDGRVYHQLPSKKKISREAREDFLNRVREFAAEYGLALQPPETEEM